MNNGGPAFPENSFIHPNGDFQWPQSGLTKLEWFAGLAMQGYIAKNGRLDPGSATSRDYDELAKSFYKMAGAMLQESDRRNAQG